MMSEKLKELYALPTCKVLRLCTRGIICDSGNVDVEQVEFGYGGGDEEHSGI